MTPFECVPNFSEGRDAAKVERLAGAARSAAGVTVLDVERNADHNRCVITLYGEGNPLIEAVVAMMRVATEVIDLTHHHGEHPRMGATDVVPFIPLGISTMPEAVRLAERLGERVGKELEIPVFLYAGAARRPERADLAKVREGQFEGLRDAIGSDPARAPDFGPARIHPTAGAVAIGARPILIAYNVYLTTPDVTVAKQIAKSVRGRDGGLPEVKALGFEIRERNLAQVSMNLTDYRVTPVPKAFDAVRREAEKLGAGIEESEIVGLIPEDAMFDAAEQSLSLRSFDRANLLERKVRAAEAAAPGHESIGSFADRVAARTPTPGGGSVSAVAAAFAAALGEMVLAYSIDRTHPQPELVAVRALLTENRTRLLLFADEDSRAYDKVREARKSIKEKPGDPAGQQRLLVALRSAASVPLETARLTHELGARLESVRAQTNALLVSDLITALALFRAATEGALANVKVNLDDLRAAGDPVASLEAEVARIRAAS
jgi:glutamate formiminotransferase / formiminotetrahydrofolate cyclodeaminase